MHRQMHSKAMSQCFGGDPRNGEAYSALLAFIQCDIHPVPGGVVRDPPYRFSPVACKCRQMVTQSYRKGFIQQWYSPFYRLIFAWPSGAAAGAA